MIERKLIVGAAIILLGAASHAQDLTREAVQAELARAQAAGEIGMTGEAWDGSFDPIAKPGAYGRPFAEAGFSREAVIAETVRARAAGEMSTGEAWDGTVQPGINPGAGVYGRAFSEPGLSRDVIRAELERARDSGELARQQYDYVGGN